MIPPTALRRRLLPLLAAVGFALVTATTAPAIADEHESPVNLSLRPVGQPGAYFDLTMEPGETRQFEVILGNNGTEAIDARTYAADVYTAVNGGLGAEERDGEPSGTTEWLDYRADVLSLPAGQQATRSLSVTVPEDAKPGEYATSLVLENDIPIEGTGEVVLNQIIRQAMPVIVRVPGALEPDFEFGNAFHRFSGERSLVGVEISNTGNERLAPAGKLTVRDDKGEIVSEAEMTMDVFFADTETSIETVLDGTLDPGDYTLSVSMTDPESGVTETAEDLLFTVERPEEGSTADDQQQEGLPEIFQNSGNGLLLALVGAAVVLLVVILLLLIRNHRRQNG